MISCEDKILMEHFQLPRSLHKKAHVLSHQQLPYLVQNYKHYTARYRVKVELNVNRPGQKYVVDEWNVDHDKHEDNGNCLGAK